MNDPLYQQMTAFLLGQGIGGMEHTGKTYLGHLIAVHRLMEEQGCAADACRAGLLHSIYGTEAFQRFQLPVARRHEVRDLIGERAERLGPGAVATYDRVFAGEPMANSAT
jgi:(p)ppGpp synthase/HD superfamily hydrolase